MSLTIFLDDNSMNRLKNLASSQNTTSEEIAGKAIEEYLANAFSKNREYEEWVLKQLQAGLKEADEGKLIDNEEVEAKMAAFLEEIGNK